MLLNFLNDNNVLKLKLLMVLESKNTIISVDELVSDLDSSEYLVSKAVENLIIDVKRIGLPVPLFTITKLENKNIQYTRESTLSPFNYLAYVYSLESDFHPFFHNFLGEQANSQIDFLSNNFISKTSFFRQRKQFERDLKPFNLKITSQVTLSGVESDIRNFIYIYLLTSHYDIRLPFSVDTENKLTDLVNELKNIMQINFSNSIQLKLKYYFYVILCRNKLNHFLLNRNNYEFDDQMKNVAYVLKSKLNLFDSVEARNITIDLFKFMFSEGVTTKFQPDDDPEILSIINNIRKDFMDFFSVNSELINSIFTPKVKLSLAQFLVHYKYFNYPSNYILDPEKISYLNENFSEYQSFSELVIRKLSDYWPEKKSLIKININLLITDLLFLIVANFNLSLLLPPIVITVDFTYGENYSQFIANEIQNFNSLNLKVTRQITRDTNILISNLSPNVIPSIHKVQWTSPPTPSDWELLGNLIVDIKKERKI